jgi:2-oxoglutarate dehydrogenase E2 component (dihydrolipoamide succinyltransferase)
MSKLRRKTADHMVRSVRISPHVTTTIEVDLQVVSEFREKNKEGVEQRTGQKLTMTAFFAQAAAWCLGQLPIFNASVDGHDILYRQAVHLGIAVAMDSGLIVPVIRHADQLNIEEMAAAIGKIAARARNHQLKPDEVIGGSFTITNPGMFGCLNSNPIINQPQVAILSVGAIVRRPTVLAEDQIVIRPICPVGITFDHRIIDGEQGARFLAKFKSFLETYNSEHPNSHPTTK